MAATTPSPSRPVRSIPRHALTPSLRNPRHCEAAAFSVTPWDEDPTGPDADRFVWRLARNSSRDGFAAVLSRDAGTDTTTGFAYGCVVAPDPPGALADLHRDVETALGGGSLAGSFALIDIAVDPTVHGSGTGGRLLDTLIDSLGNVDAGSRPTQRRRPRSGCTAAATGPSPAPSRAGTARVILDVYTRGLT